jgi:hypothetical protein
VLTGLISSQADENTRLEIKEEDESQMEKSPSMLLRKRKPKYTIIFRDSSPESGCESDEPINRAEQFES